LGLVLVVLVLSAAVWDLRNRRIPNALSLAGIVAGVSLNSFLYGFSGLRRSLSGLALALFLYVLLWLIRAVGAGDAKLMAAVGSLVGPGDWVAIFLITAILGAAIGMVLIVQQRRVRKTFDNVFFILSELRHLRAPYLAREELSVKSGKAFTLPHAVSIALGCAVFLCLPLIFPIS
jgi:prepilin peptidase CpaA